jgi:hypothetical protein
MKMKFTVCALVIAYDGYVGWVIGATHPFLLIPLYVLAGIAAGLIGDELQDRLHAPSL